jgi:hypothetical protein
MIKQKNGMGKLLIIAFFLTILSMAGYPSNEKKAIGARNCALGSTGVATPDIWSVYNNPAVTAWLTTPMAGFTAENRFMMTGLTLSGVTALYPARFGVTGISVTSFGNKLYREMEASVSFARKFGPVFSAGVGFGLFRIQADAGYGSVNLVSFQIGATLRPRESILFGVRIFNPYPIKITAFSGDILTQGVDLGLSWKLSTNCWIFGETGKLSGEPLNIRFGTEYCITPVISFQAGISGLPFSFSFGAGLHTGRWSWNISSSYHHWLGFSPSISCQYRFK